MAIDNPNTIDAIGVEKATNSVVLTIADSWDWENEQSHLEALQAKLNAYLNFIESGEIWESYPDSANRSVRIDVVSRFPLSTKGRDLVEHASRVGAELHVEIRHRHHPEEG